MDDDLVTTEEVATAARVSAGTVLRWARNGTIPAIKVGRVVRFRRSDVDAFLSPKVHAPVAVAEAAS